MENPGLSMEDMFKARARGGGGEKLARDALQHAVRDGDSGRPQQQQQRKNLRRRRRSNNNARRRRRRPHPRPRRRRS